MKSFLLGISLIFSFLWASQALASSEQIDNYQVEVSILEDSIIEVVETIDYNFGTNKKHGIYRDIPILNKSFSEIPFEIYDIAVNDLAGRPYENKVSEKGFNLNIKIGSVDSYVTGLKTYIISYKVKGAFIFGEESDDLFWNAIGTSWDVPILKNNIDIFLPKPISKEYIKFDSYFGFEGDTNSLMRILTGPPSKVEKITFHTPSLEAHQGATFNLYFDKGIINQPPPPNIALAFLKKFNFYFLLALLFSFMFYIWYRKGRDPKGRGNVIVQYSPPKDMMPAELGTIYDETVHNKDISAEIIYLAINGYLKIKRIKKSNIFSKEDYVLEKLKEPNDLSRQYQINLINNLFSAGEKTTKLSSLKNKSYKWMKEIESNIYKLVSEQGYFDKNPQKTRQFYRLIAIVVMILVFLWASQSLSFGSYYDVIMKVVYVIFIIIVLFFAKIMPKKTSKGVLAKEYILGLKEYINVAEKDRIKFHNAPAKDPKTFEKLLPYAMAFGLEKEWAKQFEGIYLQEPDWYVSGQGVNFSVTSFGASLNGFRTAASSATKTSFSGGSSGGGGGGGGGGSW